MKLQAEKRDKGKSRELRRQGRLPGVVYNNEINESLSVDARAFDKVLRSAGTSALVDLEVDGEVHAVLVKQVQMDKRRREAMHVDFYAVTANQEVDVTVPLEFTGTAVGVRDGGQLDVQRREVHIAILPRFIPAGVALDVSALVIGGTLHVSDVVPLLPPEARVLDDLDLALVAVVPPRVVEEDVTAEGEGAEEPEVIGREDDEDAGEAESED
ncbi:MAG TPA: 50S ribosomal protein L25 [Trueperaceae bacterium]|nr:50S ribosomal protein L25 [Trueperaceae bacterium]